MHGGDELFEGQTYVVVSGERHRGHRRLRDLLDDHRVEEARPQPGIGHVVHHLYRASPLAVDDDGARFEGTEALDRFALIDLVASAHHRVTNLIAADEQPMGCRFLTAVELDELQHLATP